MASKSFYDWLLEQKKQRTPIGEFARQATLDPAFPKEVSLDPAFPKEVSLSLDAVLEFLKASPQASPKALAIARIAYRTYARA
jgi:uncharacterized protein YozE (UPF0346 family)